MSDLFFLQDSRSNVGSRAMFWREGGGYTSNLNEAEQFKREPAVKQYECRETDLPWPVEYVRTRAQVGVDHQYLDVPAEQALGIGPTSNLAEARTWSLEHAAGFTGRGYLPWPKGYIDQHSRPVVQASMLDHKQALRSVGLKLSKLKRQRHRIYRDRLNCEGCGRFLSERQRFDDCPNCGARNAP